VSGVSGGAKRRRDSPQATRAELVGRVRERQSELQEAIFARIRNEARGMAGEGDPEYVAGLKQAVVAGVEYGLAGLEHGEEVLGPVPTAVLVQAQRAARTGVSLDTVLRRYVLGSTLLGDFVMQEADSSEAPAQAWLLREILNAQAAVLDQLMSAITREYVTELKRTTRSPDRRRAERVQRVLAGGRCESAELGYPLEDWHVGLIASGARAAEALRAAATKLGRPLLCLPRGEDLAWGWIGGPSSLAGEALERALSAVQDYAVTFALGEPGQGVAAWRLTHRQAQAALRVALRDPKPFTRYRDVALLASMLHDESLAGSLVSIYLAPLGGNQNGGRVLRETLKAYFAAECNASSAASALGVTRHTVERRVRTIEERLGRLNDRQAELEIALQLEELEERHAA